LFHRNESFCIGPIFSRCPVVDQRYWPSRRQRKIAISPISAQVLYASAQLFLTLRPTISVATPQAADRPVNRPTLRRRSPTVRDRIQFIADSLLSSQLSDPADSRGQAICLFGQNVASSVSAGGYDHPFIALGAALIVSLCGALLYKGRRRAITGLAAVLAILLGAASASAEPAGSPLGDWSTANGHGVIAIAQCGNALCGRIVGIDRKATEPMPTDVEGRPQCGLTIITNEQSQPDGTWLGRITDPRDGGTYQAKLWLDAQGNLRLRGFIGIPALGSTQTWHRFTGHLTGACGLA
jgi:uncharacterized protein (DUF2147 family)